MVAFDRRLLSAARAEGLAIMARGWAVSASLVQLALDRVADGRARPQVSRRPRILLKPRCRLLALNANPVARTLLKCG